MQPGEFRYKTNIKTINQVQGSVFGDFQTLNEGSVNRFAKIKWLPSAEVMQAETLTLQKNAEFTYRYESITAFIDIIDTITFDSNVFKINTVQYKGFGNQQYVVIKASTFIN